MNFLSNGVNSQSSYFNSLFIASCPHYTIDLIFQRYIRSFHTTGCIIGKDGKHVQTLHLSRKAICLYLGNLTSNTFVFWALQPVLQQVSQWILILVHRLPCVKILFLYTDYHVVKKLFFTCSFRDHITGSTYSGSHSSSSSCTSRSSSLSQRNHCIDVDFPHRTTCIGYSTYNQ